MSVQDQKKDIKNYIHTLNKSIIRLFRRALTASGFSPAAWLFIARTIIRQYRAQRIRSGWQAEGFHVPPFMIASITKQCNLKCTGCYGKLREKHHKPELSADQWHEIFFQARELGVSIILLAGGEPMMRPEIFSITTLFPDIIFPVFTNGLLWNEKKRRLFKAQKNLVPVVSLEGNESLTNARRGEGVYQSVQNVLSDLKHLFGGVSITVTSENLQVVTHQDFVASLCASGCRILFYVEYIPVEPGSEHLVPSQQQREDLAKRLAKLEKEYKAIFISFPGDEKQFGGCLAAGRGFVHINSSGDLEPCPFAPFSDTNVTQNSLKGALNSALLKEIRNSHDTLDESAGGCALWNKKEWVENLLKQ
ncbi:MAG: radical SAM protein [Candidatus Auribacter fodinae]|jgi:MoaA/NifB/PqqE/SkfB family radical SAM enzyme|uniref:Radical SAM protein n=1 Tax=Candidatus Auribacter fodinae TaxID=2093366 RepID=A0A3A4R1L9_9BACT|nr:MAG: radical SAM protein [Candidatus Auribacter fodinae]